MKTCTKCGEEKPATPEYFYKNKKHKDSLDYRCKDCVKEYKKQVREKNKKKKFIYDDKKMKECNECKIEKPATPEFFGKNKTYEYGLINTCKECRKEYSKKFYQENKEYHAEYKRKHYQKNKEKYREYYAEYYQENRGELLEYSKKHYQENQEHYKEYSKKYQQENREKLREYKRKYRLENPEVGRLSNQRRQARMAQLPHTLTDEQWEEALEFFNHSCAYCGVSDDSVGKEHIIPVVKGGGYTQDNIIPACRTCNLKKHTRDLEEWYVSYEHYDEERLDKILDYIEVND